ncbi:MAG: glucuronate isomerase [Candidatus Brocadiia bacterium]
MAKRAFITEDFLLQTPAARRLYHDYAESLPIIDYHSHLPAAQIAGDHRFKNLAQIWLTGDHYKWRALRACGVEERFCTGAAPDWEKFQKWAETVPQTLRNPLYHWTHLELLRIFGIGDRLLNPRTAKDIWEECNAKLARQEFSCRGLLRRMNVEVVCTTDDPADSLESHKAIAADASFRVRVLPAWRPDKGLAIESPTAFNAWVDRLAAAAGVYVKDYASFLDALRRRHDAFHAAGCRLSDHGLDTACAEDCTGAEIKAIFAKVRRGRKADSAEALKFKSAMLHELAIMDFEKGWVQQFHLGAPRNVNSRRFEEVGPDSGFDTIGDFEIGRPLARMLDRLDRKGKLAKTILYNANPADNELLAAMIGNFQDGRVPGKMQFGSAWWFLDQKNGMERQIEALSNIGLLSRFIGMTTDSRSFLSYPRHEYFRRVLCNILGGEIESGLLPRDMALVGGMVRDICHDNAEAYFRFGSAK